MNAMFRQLRNAPSFIQRQKRGERLSFVDLGSGDGRVVFRASRENLFDASIGYELNPLLHIFASLRRTLSGPRAWSTTEFHRRDLWDVDLRNNADVVAVVRGSSHLSAPKALFLFIVLFLSPFQLDPTNRQYGLGPIMENLGVKLKDELKPGSFVLSNVFSFPGWKPESSSSDGTFLYLLPDCWERQATDSSSMKGQNAPPPK